MQQDVQNWVARIMEMTHLKWVRCQTRRTVTLHVTAGDWLYEVSSIGDFMHIIIQPSTFENLCENSLLKNINKLHF